jgi:hypothetical protein
MAKRELIDAVVLHQIELQRYSNNVVRRIMAVLNRADADIAAALLAMLERAPESVTVEYLDSLLSSVRQLNASAYTRLQSELEARVRELADFEARWTQSTYTNTLEIETQFARVTAESAYTAAMARPFQGRLLREWGPSLEASRMQRIRDAVRMGYVEGKTTAQVVREIRGTKARGFQDGIIEIDRRHAESVARTALSHMAATTRDRFFEANDDILGDEVWVSTLDGRTSQECRIRDGKRYTRGTHRPVGHSIPWSSGPGRLHWQCRSTAIALLKGQTELFGTRAAKGGQVDANESYGDWLRRQSASVQDDVLGASRGALFRRGGLKIEQFSNDKGKALTLPEMEERHAAAFRRAGVESRA